MPYRELCDEMEKQGYLAEPIALCRRATTTPTGVNYSKLENYLRESLTYSEYYAKRPLWDEFDKDRALPVVLFIEDGAPEHKRHTFDLLYDEQSQVVRRAPDGGYGSGYDVFSCLHRKNESGELVPLSVLNLQKRDREEQRKPWRRLLRFFGM